jgi:hypothetical protein
VQILTDLTAVKLTARVSIRALAIWAHILSFAGLTLLGILPAIIPNTFAALLAASVIYSVGGGLIEVVISPIVDAITKQAIPSITDFASKISGLPIASINAPFTVIAPTQNKRLHDTKPRAICPGSPSLATFLSIAPPSLLTKESISINSPIRVPMASEIIMTSILISPADKKAFSDTAGAVSIAESSPIRITQTDIADITESLILFDTLFFTIVPSNPHTKTVKKLTIVPKKGILHLL